MLAAAEAVEALGAVLSAALAAVDAAALAAVVAAALGAADPPLLEQAPSTSVARSRDRCEALHG